MTIDYPHTVALLVAAMDDLRARVKAGQPIDEDWLFEHQPTSLAFSVSEVLRWLRAVQADPSRWQEFVESAHIGKVTP